MLTADELHVADLFAEAYNAFVRLPRQHPSELRDAADATHRLQDLIGMRCLRDDYPDKFPIKKGTDFI